MFPNRFKGFFFLRENVLSSELVEHPLAPASAPATAQWKWSQRSCGLLWVGGSTFSKGPMALNPLKTTKWGQLCGLLMGKKKCCQRTPSLKQKSISQVIHNIQFFQQCFQDHCKWKRGSEKVNWQEKLKLTNLTVSNCNFNCNFKNGMK